MSDIDSVSELDIIIKEVKQELKTLFEKRKDQIIRLGNAFEKVISNPESVCEEIKNSLKEEIADKVISVRTIELYCYPKWKKKTKPKNEKISFSNKQRKEEEPIAIGNNGNLVENNPSADEPSYNNNNRKVQASNHCERCKLLENRNERLQEKVQDYEDALKKASWPITADNQTINEDKDSRTNYILHSEKSSEEDSECSPNQVLDFEASVSWKTMQRYLNILYKSGKPLKVWFNGKIDKITGNVIAAYPGKISERNEMNNEENNETTT